MGQRIFWRCLILGTIVLSVLIPKGWALVKFDDGKDQVFVNASVAIGYDSNIFARKGGGGDFLTSSSFGIEYARHAGYIAINASATWSLGQFSSNTAQNFSNPSLNLELIKNSGRTTGSFTLNATRQSSADTALNIRTDSWNYNAGLNWKYPVIDRYSISGGLNYGLIDYQQPAPGIYNLTTYGASADLFYAYTSERDLIAGYAIQFSDTGANTESTDHIFTAGVSGKILPKINGTVRAGYEIRQESGTGQTFDTWNASSSVTWNLSRRTSFTGTLKKSFSTIATTATIDTLAANLDMQYTLNAKWSIYAGIGGGENDFLSGASTGRVDDYFTWSVGVNYSMNEHFKASLTYSFYKNWSTQGLGNYDRDSITLNLSTRW